jgi:hypothetical protein
LRLIWPNLAYVFMAMAAVVEMRTPAFDRTGSMAGCGRQPRFLMFADRRRWKNQALAVDGRLRAWSQIHTIGRVTP